jgi:predicted membrane protein
MKRWQIVMGIILIVLGLFSLVDTIFEVNLWLFFFPLFLVGLGLLLILRPRFAKPGVQVLMPVLGDTRREGTWEAVDLEIWSIVGTNRLDFTQASFPNGTANIKIMGFVVDARIALPDDVGLSIETVSFVTELKSPEGKEEHLFNSIDYQSPNYQEAVKKINLQTVGFVTEIRVNMS